MQHATGKPVALLRTLLRTRQAADFDTRGCVQLNMVLRMLADMPRIVRERT